MRSVAYLKRYFVLNLLIAGCTESESEPVTNCETSTDVDQKLRWVQQAGGSDSDSSGGIAAAPDGSFVVAGGFYDRAVFGTADGNRITLGSGGGQDIFIARYNPEGGLVWARRAGGGNNDSAWDVALQPDGTVLASGVFMGEAVFGPGEPNETTVTAETQNSFVAGFSSMSGDLLFARAVGTGGNSLATDLATGAEGSFFVTGKFEGSTAFGPTGSLTSVGAGDVFLAKYDAAGQLVWVDQSGGAAEDEGRSVTGLSDGSLIVAGGFEGAATFGRGGANEIALTSGEGRRSVFIARHSAAGAPLWVRQAAVDASRRVLVSGVAELSDGAVLLAGEFESTITFSPGEATETTLTGQYEKDLFIAKYSADGVLAWTTSAGGFGYDTLTGISALSDGAFAVTGGFSEEATFGFGEAAETTLAGLGAADTAFFAKYHPDGTLAWVEPARGDDKVIGAGVSALPDGGFLAAGDFYINAEFGSDACTPRLKSEGGSDVFIIKLGP